VKSGVGRPAEKAVSAVLVKRAQAASQIVIALQDPAVLLLEHQLPQRNETRLSRPRQRVIPTSLLVAAHRPASLYQLSLRIAISPRGATVPSPSQHKRARLNRDVKGRTARLQCRGGLPTPVLTPQRGNLTTNMTVVRTKPQRSSRDQRLVCMGLLVRKLDQERTM
jgi:hypothetical protein